MSVPATLSRSRSLDFTNSQPLMENRGREMALRPVWLAVPAGAAVSVVAHRVTDHHLQEER